MALRFSTGLRNRLLGTASFKDIFQDGVIYVYSGNQPASADNSVSGTLLGKVTQDGNAFTFGSPDNGLEFADPVGNEINKDPDEVWKMVAEADGTLGWFRLMGNAQDDLSSSQTLPRIDGSIGTYGKDLIVATASVTAGAPLTIDEFRISLPES